MWDVTHKALPTSIYKQISYYGIALEYNTEFKAQLDCHYNRWSLKILVFFLHSWAGFAQVSPYRASSLLSTEFSAPQLASSVPLCNPTSPALISSTNREAPYSRCQVHKLFTITLALFIVRDAPKSFIQVSSLRQHHIHLSCSLKYKAVLSVTWNCEDYVSE